MDTDVIPCPDCGKTENRDYSQFRFWFADPQRDMELLLDWVKTEPCHLDWVKTEPCHQCAVKRRERQKRRYQGGRPIPICVLDHKSRCQ